MVYGTRSARSRLAVRGCRHEPAMILVPLANKQS
jgi:hypothetical protein